MKSTSVCAVRVFVFLLMWSYLAPSISFGIILHPDGEPNLAVWTDRPDVNVVGRWGSNASCVAVSSNCIITTRHQGGGIGTSVYFGGIQYSVQEVWNEPGAGGTGDLRVCRIQRTAGGSTNLADYVLPYTNTDEQSELCVIGGYGKGRGADVLSGITVIGYEWLGGNNQTQRWGQNKIESTGTGSSPGYISDVIVADFDAPDTHGSSGAQDYEATLALWDSGGGWFIDDGGEWKVAGLSRGVPDHNEQSWFGDGLDAVRVSSYATWIADTIVERVPADLTLNDWVDSEDFAILAKYWRSADCNSANNWCDGADFEPSDGSVDFNDLDVMVNWWLCGYDCF